MIDTVIVYCVLPSPDLICLDGWVRRYGKNGIYFVKRIGHFRFKIVWGVLFVSFSAPLVLYGSNIYQYVEDDYEQLNALFMLVVSKAVGEEFGKLPLKQWEVSKIDFCCNYTVDRLPFDKKAVEAAIRFVKKTEVPYCKMRRYESSSFGVNKTRKVLIYDKCKEREAKIRNYTPQRIDKVIRVEIGLRLTILRKEFDQGVLFGEVARQEAADLIIRKHLKTYQLDKPFCSMDQVLSAIKTKAKNA